MSYRNAREALEARREALGAELAELRTQAASLADLTERIAKVQRALESAEENLHALPLRTTSPLEDIRVASPCNASWDAMQGDDQVRFCGQCRKDVFNLSAMTRDEAEGLLAARNGSICVRLYRRADGTVLTTDCPVGVRRKTSRRVALAIVGSGAVAVAATVASAFTVMGEPARPIAAAHVPSPIDIAPAQTPPPVDPITVQGGIGPQSHIEMGEPAAPPQRIHVVQGHMSRPQTSRR